MSLVHIYAPPIYLVHQSYQSANLISSHFHLSLPCPSCTSLHDCLLPASASYLNCLFAWVPALLTSQLLKINTVSPAPGPLLLQLLFWRISTLHLADCNLFFSSLFEYHFLKETFPTLPPNIRLDTSVICTENNRLSSYIALCVSSST